MIKPCLIMSDSKEIQKIKREWLDKKYKNANNNVKTVTKWPYVFKLLNKIG
jgi:hypothetical protein